MADQPQDSGIETGLADAKDALEKIRDRIMAGEEVDEKELTMLARTVATQLENVRARLEEVVGPIDPELIKEEMRKRMSPEEYQQWLDQESERNQFREEVKKERAIRNQLGEPEL